ncbi:MAG: two-component system response regulator LytT [Clostridium sp.]
MINILNIVVCDDNVGENEVLICMVKEYMGNRSTTYKVTSFIDGDDLIEYISNSKNNIDIDIVFLDVYMEFSNGIETAKKLREYDKECRIIFITSSKEHAIDSYEVQAFNYLLKPVDKHKLYYALSQVIESINKDNNNYVAIKNKQGNFKIKFSDITFLESEKRRIHLHTKNNSTLTFYGKLDEICIKLTDERFMRCHKSYCVNMENSLKIEGNIFIMENKIKIPISYNISQIRQQHFDYLLKKM